MEGVNILNLLNLVICLNDDERKTIEENIIFKPIIDKLRNSADYIEIGNEKACGKQLKSVVSHLTQTALDHLSGITATNQGIANYITKLLDEHRVMVDGVKLASIICALGNNDTTYTVTQGIEKLVSWIKGTEQTYHKAIEDKEELEKLNVLADQLVMQVTLSQILCTYMIAKYGSETGIGEHFCQNVKETPTDLGEADTDHSEAFEAEVAGNEIYSLFESYERIIDGLESFIQADGYVPIEQQTFNQRYTLGVLISHGIIMTEHQGMEGAMWDKVKTGLQKAFKIVRDGLTALKENYFDKSLEEISDDLKASADENKKALNAVEKKDAVLTDSAKKGITVLGNKTNNPDIVTAIASLTNVGSAPGVIDKLMAVFSTVYGAASKMQTEFNEVDANLKTLESGVNSGAPDDDDKEAMSVKKAAMSEKSKEVKAQFDELKKKLSDQRAQVSAIAKAIKGIKPGIFYAPKEGTSE